MERSIVVPENHQSSNSNLVFKSIESSVMIDSISIELANANEKSDVEKCEHFSIRGYVSAFRKKDWKRCWPFVSDGDSDKLEEQTFALPSFHVPKFRFWRCENCLSEIGAKGTANSYEPVPKSCNTGFKSNSICSHARMLGDAAMISSNFQQAPKLDIDLDGRIDVNASANLNNTTEYHPSSCNDKEEKKTEVANGPIIGHNMGLEDELNQEIHTLTCVATEVVSSPMQKTCSSDDVVDFRAKCNGSIDQCKPVCGHHEVADAEKIYETGKELPVDDHHKELMACGTSGEAANVDEELATDKDHASGHPSLGLDECDYPSSESAEIMVGNNSQDLHHENSSSLHRKKTRKVRLLTELLCENGDGDNDNIRTEDSMSNAIPDASAGVHNLPVAQGQVTIQRKVRRVLSQTSKRKLPQDEDWRALETNSPNNLCKEDRILKTDVQNNAIAGSESEEDALGRMGLQTGVKNNWTKCKVDRSPITVKKKNKKTLIFEEGLSLAPSKENLPNEIGEKIGDVSKGNAGDGVLVENTFSGREMDLFPLPAQRMERKPSFGKKKNKMSQVDDSQVSLTPWNHGILKEGPMTRKDVEIIHARPMLGPFYSAEETSLEKGLNLSLSSCMTSQRYDMKYVPQVEARQNSLLTWQDGTSEDQVMRKAAEAKYIGNFGFTSKSAPDATFGRKIDNDLSSKQPTYKMPFFNEKPNYTSQVESGGCSVMRHKGLCSTSNNENTIAIQEHPAVARKDIDQRADKVSEQGGLDDIPMEIVELMAKNQYERCLPDAEHDKCRLETTNNTRSSQKMDFRKAYGHGEFDLFHQETTQIRNPRAKNGRNGITKKGENVGRAKQKAVDYLSQPERNQCNITQLEQIHTPAGFGAFLQHQEKPSSGVQHCASSSSRQNSAQNCKWIGDVMGKRSSHPCLQASGPCNACQNISLQSKEGNHIWSSMMPNPIPFVCGISQKCAAPSAAMDILSHSPGSMHKESMNGDHDMRFLNQNAANLGKPNRNLGSETLSRTSAEYPFACKQNGIELNQKPIGSLDLYSNETIPAMHLLSLMDAGLRSSAPINMNVTPKILKRPSISHEHDPKEISRLDSGAYRATNTMKYPPYNYHGKNQLAENSREHIPAVPTMVGASASSFQHDKNFKMATDVTSQVVQDKGKRKGSDSHSQNKGFRSQKSASTTGGLGTNCGSIPVHSMQTLFFGTSDSMIFPLPFHALENSTQQKLESRGLTRAVHPRKSSFETEICSVNRNPADFSAPEAGNMYMIAGEDLKVERVAPSANRSGLIKLDGHKRQRKLPAVKERGRHLIA